MLRGKLKTQALAKISVAANVAHALLTVSFPRQFLPSTTASFPVIVQILFWVEFGLAGIVICRPIDSFISSNAYPPSDVEAISITSSVPVPPSRWTALKGDWGWAIATLISFILLFALTLHLHPAQISH